jgi:predicted RNA binding protein YcfA (HicA-like mRNA interferase family)
LRSASGKQLCKALEKHGWVLQRIRGSHYIYAKPGNPAIATVPVHGQRDLKAGTFTD